MSSRLSATVTLAVVVATGVATGLMTSPAGAASSADQAKAPLTRVSHDPYNQAGAQHATEAEPDTFAHKKTIVSVFQTGRYSDGGSVNTGWATSKNRGRTWKHGFLPGITTPEGGQWARVSDPVIAYDAKHHTWLASGLVLDANVNGRGVVVSSSRDGLHWNDPVLAVGNDAKSYDKDWIACDNSSSSPYFGNCYVEVDLPSSGNLMVMVTSSDGGQTWGSQKVPSGSPSGLGGQPVVQPDGTVVVPYSANYSAVRAFSSDDGGNTWGSSVTVSSSNYHEVTGVRQEPLPTAEVDASGRVYVAWEDCRYRNGCASNDIVMSTSDDGTSWSSVVRVPIDSTDSGRDHFIPGLGVSPKTSGNSARLGLYYYFYPNAACTVSTCKLKVGYISSADGGSTWSKAKALTKAMSLSWLAQAGGAMVGDYISCSVIGKKAVSVFAVGKPPKGSTKNQAMYSAGPLAVTGGSVPAGSQAAHPSGHAPVGGLLPRPLL